MPKKRSKSLSLSDELLSRLNHMWYEEIRKHLNRNERISFSDFVEQLLWEIIKLKNR